MTYLERLKEGEDPTVLLLEAQEEIDANNKAINSVMDRVLEGGDSCEIMTDIVEIIPFKLIKTNGDI